MQYSYISVDDTRSENDVVNSSETAKAKVNAPGATNIPYTANSLTLLNDFSITTEIDERNAAMAKQISDKQAYYTYKNIVENLVKGMIDEINRNIKLGKFPFSSGFKNTDREYYGISFDDETYPDMSTEHEFRKVVNNMINGDKKRIADGKPVLKAFPWDTLELWNNQLKTKFDTKELSFDETKVKQKAVTAKVKYYNDTVYPELKADAIHFYRNEPKETFRRLSGEFGILFRHYGSDPNVYGYAFGVASNEGVPLSDAEVTVEGTEIKVHTNKSGFWSTAQVKLGKQKFICKKFPFADIVLEDVDIKQGIEEEVNFIFLSEDEETN